MVYSLLGSTAIAAMCAVSGPSRAQDTEVFLSVIAKDGDAAPGVSGVFDLPFSVSGNATYVDDTGSVYFFSETDTGGGFGSSFSGIWTGGGGGGGLTPIAVEGQALPGFELTPAECLGLGPTCGELFNVQDIFNVSPDGETIFRASRDEGLDGTLAILSRVGTNPATPLLTDDDDADVDDGRVSRVTRGGVYFIGDFVGNAPFGSGAGTSLIDGALENYVDPLIDGPAPGAGTFTTIDSISGVSAFSGLDSVNERGDILYRADLSDGDVALYLNPASSDTDDTLILLTETTAPGLADGKFIGVDIAGLNDNGEGFVRAFWNETADPPVGDAREGLWRFDETGTLELVASNRNDLDDAFFAVEGFGAQQFIFSNFVDFSAATIAPNGDVYFFAAAEPVNSDGTPTVFGAEISGLWRGPAGGGPLELVIQRRDADDAGTSLLNGDVVAGFDTGGAGNDGFGFDAEGNLVIAINARDINGVTRTGLYVFTTDDEVLLIAEQGQLVDVAPGVSLEIADLSFSTQEFVGGTLSSFRNDNFAFNVQFADNSVAVVQARLQGVVVVVTDFTWSGACGNADWHAGCAVSNWNDPDGDPANLAPGDANGTESAAINNADVVISARAVDLDTLNATGSLSVQQSLTLRNASSIENLMLSNTLISGGDTVLTGAQNSWTDGTISGAGQVWVSTGSTLTITPDNTSVDLETTLAVSGTTVQTDGTLNLVGADALLDIRSGGTYEIQNGSIIDDTTGTTIQNAGTLLKTGGSTATINAGFENNAMGEVRVEAGTLQFTDTSTWAGNLRVLEGAVAEISGSTANFGSASGNFSAAGAGILRLSGATINVFAGTQNLFDFTSTPLATSPAVVEITNGTTFSGGGTLRNEGQMTLVGDGISFAAGLMFENGGVLSKTGAGTTTVSATFANDGASGASPGGIVQVQEGRLAFTSPSTWGGQLEISAGATADFSNTDPTFSALSGAGFDVLGEGVLQLDGGMVTNVMGAQTRFNLLGETGAVVLDGGVTLAGAGSFLNQGQMRVPEGTIEAEFTNDGMIILENGGLLSIAESANMFTNSGAIVVSGQGQSVINGPLDDGVTSNRVVANSGSIDVGTGSALLTQFTTLVFNEGSTVTLSENATATFDRNFIDVMGSAQFSGSGTLNIGDPATNAAQTLFIFSDQTLTNSISFGEVMDNALSAGVNITEGGLISGPGRFRNLGDITFSGGLVATNDFVNEGSGRLVIGGSAGVMRQLDGDLTNRGEIWQTADLLLGNQARIENEAAYRLIDGAGISIAGMPSMISARIINTKGGTLSKTGTQTSTIGVDFQSLANVDVADGALVLARSGLFSGDTGDDSTIATISLSSGAQLTLQSNIADQIYRFVDGRTQVVGALGDGLFSIADDISVTGGVAGSNGFIPGPGDDGELVISASAQWTGGQLLLGNTDAAFEQGGRFVVGGEAGPGHLGIANGVGPIIGQTQLLFNSNVFRVAANGMVVQEGTLLTQGNVDFDIRGIYEVRGDINVNSGDSVALGAPITLSDSGTLRIAAAQSVAIEKRLAFDETNSNSVVEVEQGATLKLNPDSRPFRDASNLETSRWILRENAVITQLDGTTPLAPIDDLVGSTSLLLSEGARFLNLPTVNGSFGTSTESSLTLINTTMNIMGDASINGALNGSNSVINVTGEYRVFFGALFGGNGVTLNANAVLVNGMQDVGMSPGTMTINSDYTLGETGVLNIELGGTQVATTYDQLIINGDATLAQGAQITISLIDPDLNDDDDTIFVPETGDTFDIVVADSFDLSSQDLEDILTFTDLPTGLSFEFGLVSLDDATVLQLSAIFGSSLLEVPDLTMSQNALAGVLDTVSRSGTSEQITALALGVDGLASDEAKRGALDQVNHSFATSFVDLARTAARTSHMQITNRLDSLIWQETVIDATLQQSTAALAASGAPAPVPGSAPALDISGADQVSNYASAWLGSATAGEATLMDRNGIRVFVSASYERGDFGATQNQTGFDYDGRTGTVGLEYASADGAWMVGVAGTFSSFDGDADLSRGSVDADSSTISGYGFVKAGPAVFDAVLSYGSMDQETERRVTFPDQAFTASAETDADFLSVTARISAPFERGKLRFGPVAAISYTDIDVNGFNESGAGQTGLMLADQDAQYAAAQLGGRVLMRYQAGDWRIEPRLTAALHHAFVNDAPTVDARFIGAPDNPFMIPTEAIDDTSLSLDAGVTFYSKGRFSLSADYNGFLLNSETVQHSISARLAARF